MSKKQRGEYTITNTDLGSTEMVYIVLSVLESLGYPGLIQLMAIINDPVIIFKVIRFLYNTDLKIPPLKKVVDALDCSVYMFSDMFKRVNMKEPAQPKFIREHMNITPEREKELLEIFDNWSKFMYQQGVDPLKYLNVQRNNTKKRIQMGKTGKRWTQAKY